MLSLNWREIATNPPAESGEREEFTQLSALDIDALVQKVRSQRFDKIQDQCGILQLLDINRPVAIDHIYIDVNILEEIASLQYLEITELQNLDREEFDRFGLSEIDQRQIPFRNFLKESVTFAIYRVEENFLPKSPTRRLRDSGSS